MNRYGRNGRGGRDRRRALGQHFLSDRGIARRIVDSLGELERASVLEIGPGRGVLTLRLAEKATALTALELDPALARSMAEQLVENPSAEVLNTDFLRFDLAGWAGSAGELQPVVVGNIPYSITNSIVHRLLEHHEYLSTVVLMVQEEVARKLTAPHGGKPYGMVSVLAAYRARPEYLFRVDRRKFSPPPRVDSAVVKLDFRAPAAVRAADEWHFERLVRRLFLERRKQIQKVLRNDSLYRLSRADLERIERETGLSLAARPEELAVEDFVALSDALVRESKQEEQ